MAINPLKWMLWKQVVLGMALGIAAGFIFGEDAAFLKIFGTLFITLIKMVIVPLVFFALIYGITNLADVANIARVATKGILAYISTGLFAVVIGLVMGSIFRPGVGVHLDAALGLEGIPQAERPGGLLDLLIGAIPSNSIQAMAEGNILQVVVFAMFTGVVLNLCREKCQNLITVCHESAVLVFRMIEIIVKVSPIGVFGFMAWLVGTQGMDIIITLTELVITVIIACAIQYVLFGVFIKTVTGLSPMPFYRKMVEPQLLAFSTTSSKAALTTTMRTLHEKMGVSQSSVNFILPLGASINLDGTAIYLGICAVFFAQAAGITLEWHDYIVLMFTCTIASIGAAGIPSGSLIFMSMVLHSVGLPLEGIGLIVGIDRILDMFRTTINITGDAAITAIIDHTEGKMDVEKYLN